MGEKGQDLSCETLTLIGASCRQQALIGFTKVKCLPGQGYVKDEPGCNLTASPINRTLLPLHEGPKRQGQDRDTLTSTAIADTSNRAAMHFGNHGPNVA